MTHVYHVATIVLLVGWLAPHGLRTARRLDRHDRTLTEPGSTESGHEADGISAPWPPTPAHGRRHSAGANLPPGSVSAPFDWGFEWDDGEAA